MFLSVHPEVQAALNAGKAVVALESTIISHGMPWPQNIATAQRVEAVVRKAGAVPATCAVINGRLKAGLTPDELEYLGKSGQLIPKASRRDLAYLVGKGLSGATTVASTMIIAHQAGIKVFATGGIGGVHRGAAQTMDISADLQELARTPVAVVCAGAKSILDIGLTLEYLETMGVPVLGFQTRAFPAFFTRESGFEVDFMMNSAQEIAAMMQAQQLLGLHHGILVANPVPVPFQMDALEMERAISAALEQADKAGVKGKAITPFLLAAVEQITGGKSLATNIELVCNNAGLAAEIAIALSAFPEQV
jgi:pseudouridine-5'-phosphate glycosidase